MSEWCKPQILGPDAWHQLIATRQPGGHRLGRCQDGWWMDGKNHQFIMVDICWYWFYGFFHVIRHHDESSCHLYISIGHNQCHSSRNNVQQWMSSMNIICESIVNRSHSHPTAIQNGIHTQFSHKVQSKMAVPVSARSLGRNQWPEETKKQLIWRLHWKKKMALIILISVFCIL